LKKIENYDRSSIRAALEQGCDGLAGGRALFRSGDRVLLKPNLLSGRPPEKAVNTHPEVLAAVAEFLSDRGCRLSLGDSPGLESLGHALQKAGYAPVGQRYGIAVTDFHPGAEVSSRNRRWFSRLFLFDRLGEFDHLVNLPKFKTHGMMTLTLAVKNLFGLVPGKRKAAYHLSAGENQDTFARLMLEIAETCAPSLSVLDGILAMEGDGPGQGRPVPAGSLALSTHTVALDAVAGALAGVPPENHPIVRQAILHGLPGARLAEVEVLGDPIARLAMPAFTLPASVDCRWRLPGFLHRGLKNWTSAHPRILPDACLDCRKCARICPVEAIRPGRDNRLAVDVARCIRCFCCHEICPHHAIAIEPGRGRRVLDLLKGKKAT